MSENRTFHKIVTLYLGLQVSRGMDSQISAKRIIRKKTGRGDKNNQKVGTHQGS